ncbi:hypothetical protein PInf_005896 [Phytophthora infestans]|nr:hypothetical protein PInf_005896 [Phytophthora infestans]
MRVVHLVLTTVVGAEEVEVVGAEEVEVVGAEEVEAEVVGAEWVVVGEEQRIDQYMQDMEAIEDMEEMEGMEGMKLPLYHPVLTWARNLVVPMVTTSPTRLWLSLVKNCRRSPFALPSASMPSSSPS